MLSIILAKQLQLTLIKKYNIRKGTDLNKDLQLFYAIKTKDNIKTFQKDYRSENTFTVQVSTMERVQWVSEREKNRGNKNKLKNYKIN